MPGVRDGLRPPQKYENGRTPSIFRAVPAPAGPGLAGHILCFGSPVPAGRLGRAGTRTPGMAAVGRTEYEPPLKAFGPGWRARAGASSENSYLDATAVARLTSRSASEKAIPGTRSTGIPGAPRLTTCSPVGRKKIRPRT